MYVVYYDMIIIHLQNALLASIHTYLQCIWTNTYIFLQILWNKNIVYCLLRCLYPMLGQCWPSVADGGPTLTQHWVNVLFIGSCLHHIIATWSALEVTVHILLTSSDHVYPQVRFSVTWGKQILVNCRLRDQIMNSPLSDHPGAWCSS